MQHLFSHRFGMSRARTACVIIMTLVLISSCGKANTGNAEMIAPAVEPVDTAARAATMAARKNQGPYVYFVSPLDKATVTSPVKVIFGLEGMGIAPAGVRKDGTGHHHLLVNVDELPPLNLPLPSNDNVIHFGGGQTQTIIDLAPGEHTLQLLLGNFAHIPHETPILSEKISITVVAVDQ